MSAYALLPSFFSIPLCCPSPPERLIEIGRSISAAAKSTSDKIVTFLRRHPKVFWAYGIMGVALLACGVPWTQMLVHTLPGAWYMMAFQQGDPVVRDFVSRITGNAALDTQEETWLPKKADEAKSDSLRSRMDQLNKVVQEAPFTDYIAITGESRIGKSAALHWVAQRLEEQGYAVYQLKLGSFLDNRYGGNADSRFLMLEEFLAKERTSTGKRPILVTDEYCDVGRATGLFHALKNRTKESYTLLTVMTTSDLKALKDQDGAHANRFDLSSYSLDPLSYDAIIEVLTPVFQKKVSKKLVEKAVKAISELHPSEQPMLLSRTRNLLDRACRSCNEGASVVTEEILDSRIAGLPSAVKG